MLVRNVIAKVLPPCGLKLYPILAWTTSHVQRLRVGATVHIMMDTGCHYMIRHHCLEATYPFRVVYAGIWFVPKILDMETLTKYRVSLCSDSIRGLVKIEYDRFMHRCACMCGVQHASTWIDHEIQRCRISSELGTLHRLILQPYIMLACLNRKLI